MRPVPLGPFMGNQGSGLGRVWQRGPAPPFRAGDDLGVPGVRRQLRQGECCPEPHPPPTRCPPGADRVLTARLGHCLEEKQGLPMDRWLLTRWPGPVSIFSPLTRHLPGRYFSQKAPLR